MPPWAGSGDLDLLRPPTAPLDILVQQLVAEVAACGEATCDDLFELAIAAAPYAALTRERFDEALDLATHGVVTGRGRRGAHLHLDARQRGRSTRRRRALAALLGGRARSPSSASTAWSSTPTT